MSRLNWDRARRAHHSPLPPTEKQIKLLAKLGHQAVPLSRLEASRIIRSTQERKTR